MTLVEVVVALGVLSIGMLAAAQSIVGGMHVTREVMEQTSARSIAEARVALLRNTLRQASWVSGTTTKTVNQSTKDARFNAVIAFHNTTQTANLLDAGGSTTQSIPCTVRTYVYATNEPLITQAPQLGNAGGLGMSNVDLEADGGNTDTNVQVANLQMVGVKVEVTWKPSTWKPGQAESLARVVALIY
jgi:type II secretory pathway pseudopilin PulG